MVGGVYLSGDIIEEILSYLPVKSLIRFKSVSKSWYSTISGASFAGDHIRRQRNNNHRFLIGPINNRSHRPLLIEIKKDWQMQKSLLLERRPKFPEPYHPLCYGDGLTVCYDIRCAKKKDLEDDDFVYAVWNPSTRTLLKFQCPYNSMMKECMALKNSSQFLFGIGYDSSTNEYKFVICNRVQYAIFYCRNKCLWSEIKNVEGFTFTTPQRCLGISYSYHCGFFSQSNGDFYWYLIHNESTGSPYIEVICFDAREEKLKRLPDWPFTIPEGDHEILPRIVACEEGNLALFYKVICTEDYSTCDEKLLVLKTGEGGEYSWTTFIDGMPKLQSGYTQIYPLYLTMKDEIVVLITLGKDESNGCLLLYNKREQKFIEKLNDSSHPLELISYHHNPDYLIPFRDNLFFSNPENGGHWIQESIL